MQQVSEEMPMSSLTLEELEATKLLVSICRSQYPDASQVRACVAQGADVCYAPADQALDAGHGVNTPLHYLVSRQCVEAVQECLHTSRPIDFTLRGSNGSNVLHLVCTMPKEIDAVRCLKEMVDRMERNPLDTVPWRQKGTGSELDFLGRVAMSKRMHLFWPLLGTNVPMFADATGPISLPYMYTEDWEKLSTEDQRLLNPEFLM